MTVVPTRPEKDVCQEKYLNEGRKLGAEARSRPRQAYTKMYYVFLNGPNPTSFCLFSFFSHDQCRTNFIINDKSIDGVTYVIDTMFTFAYA